ncbi:MAG TPA: GAF domain-containing protein, partial [Myxococcota bacterium]|nr:GAF domain-containing protein [Myxococcota bacterium]
VFARPNTDDRTWTPMRVPTERTTWDKRWKGYGWYRRHVYAGPRALGAELMLTMGPAREVVEVYLNGTLIMQRGHFGTRLAGDSRVLPLRAILPAGMLKSGENVIAVRVYDPSFTGGLPAGPLLLGPTHAVLERVSLPGNVALVTRLALAVVALCIALSLLLVHAGTDLGRGDTWWGAGAGLSLCMVLLAGTGVLTTTLPSLELAVRLPVAAQPLALLCLANFFAARYDDIGSRPARIGRYLLAIISAGLLLAPDKHVFLGGNAVSFLCALLTTLYGAHLLAMAARRQEGGTLPVFAMLLGLIGLLVYDAMVPAPSDLYPAWSAVGAVGVLAMSSLMGARQNGSEHQKTLLALMRLRKQLDGRVWMDILEATASAITKPQAFLDAVAHDIARDMEVRRCSIILPDMTDRLYIAACKGLPKQARHNALLPGRSVARQVFDTGMTLTPETLPEDLKRSAEQRRHGNYETNGFVASPIRAGDRILGVLNVTDRNNGGAFTPADEARVSEVANRLALVLERLEMRLDRVIKSAALENTQVTPRLIKASEPEPEAQPLPIADDLAPPGLLDKRLS